MTTHPQEPQRPKQKRRYTQNMRAEKAEQRHKNVGRKQTNQEKNAGFKNDRTTEEKEAANAHVELMVMDILNIPKKRGLQRFLRADPISRSGQRLQMVHLLTISIVPIIILFSFSSYVFAQTIDDSKQEKVLESILESTSDLAQLIHALQKERDMSALYISDIGPKTKSFLIDTYPNTDLALDNMDTWPVRETDNGAAYQSKIAFQLFLNSHRYGLDSDTFEHRRNMASVEELHFYTDMIEVFQSWTYDTFQQAEGGSEWNTLVALAEIIEAKESFGMEMALGTLYYINGGFENRMQYMWFLESQDTGNQSLQEAMMYSPLAHDVYMKYITENDEFQGPIGDMRNHIRGMSMFEQSTNEVGSLDMATEWFDSMTSYLDALLKMQTELNKRTLTLLAQHQADDYRTQGFIISIFCGVLVISPAILISVYRLTHAIQNTSTKLADKTKSLCHERANTHKLLYRMIPQSVAEKLKQDVKVEPEKYDDVTVMFINIVGFNMLSSRSTPEEVVGMLNCLYMNFDELIDKHDVCKTVTIGHAYIVASGLPNKNGKKHGPEVAILALKVLDRIQILEIPHLPGKRFKLRIGINTGPIVAGVVMTPMPQYCFFGEALDLAKKMEITGKDCSIQITEQTRNILTQDPEFVMEKRNDPDEGSRTTFWLKDHNGLVRGRQRLQSTSSSTTSDDTTYA